MTVRFSIAATLVVATLSACGSTEVRTGSPIAGRDPITEADYIGKTFPLRFIGIDDGTARLKRGTGSARYISANEIAVSIDGKSETVFRIVAGEYAGPTLNFDTSALSPALKDVFAAYSRAGYAGFLGFETARGDIPQRGTVTYSNPRGSILLESDGVFTNESIGSTALVVNFGTTSVTGDLYFQDSTGFAAEIVGGKVSGNGITGGVQIYDGTRFVTTTGDDTSGKFYGNDAGDLAGTFEGTYDDRGVPVDFVGTFSGSK